MRGDEGSSLISRLIPLLSSVISLRSHAATVALLFAVLGCDSGPPAPPPDTPPPPAYGNLSVTVTGLPSGAAAAVSITGPDGFARSIPATQLFLGVRVGSYTVVATDVVVGATTFGPTPPTQTVSVLENTSATAAISYSSPAPPPPPPPFAIRAQEVMAGFTNPVHVTALPGDSRLFVVEQGGLIRIIEDGAVLTTPFLDARSKVNCCGERGLLSLAFDPAYANNGRFYIYYTNSLGDVVVDRHTVSANPDVADAAFVQVISIPHRTYGNHNGGLVTFGPDGMLYLAPGDGGSGGDPDNHGQNINSLLGKLLRLNVTELPYTIPPDNPYANQPGADEIWAIGLRNPWRYSFDVGANPAMLYIADVGQNLWEEVDAVSASTGGLNYGWRLMEASACYNPSSGCNQTGLTLPVHEYSHSLGCSVTGGFVYRGSALPEVVGHYFYSDYCSGWLRSFRLSGGAATDHRTWTIGSVGNVTSFGLDGVGEMYMTSANGRVYKLVRQ